MIGNDIVDIKKAKIDSNWRRKGYLQKVYTPKEQALILNHADPDLIVWIFWSMKEAVYKANQRITSLKEYAPTKINCRIERHIGNSVFYGKVCYNQRNYCTQTLVFEDYIHSMALYNTDEFENIRKIYIGKYSSENYMEFLIKNDYLKYPEKIIKNKYGLPDLHNEESLKLVSISHHGSYLGIITTC